MNRIQSLAVSTLTAASTLLFVALSAPAQACVTCGLKLNGTELNGMKFNGWKINGIKVNGMRLNGMKLNGLQLNGADLQVEGGQVVAITLPTH